MACLELPGSQVARQMCQGTAVEVEKQGLFKVPNNGEGKPASSLKPGMEGFRLLHFHYSRL